MKIAYICEPQLGGTFTFFLRLRPALLARGIDMRCVTTLPAEAVKGTRFEGVEGLECAGVRLEDLSPPEADNIQDPTSNVQLSNGTSKADKLNPTPETRHPDLAALRAGTARMIQYLLDHRYDMIMVLPAADMMANNLPAYLPRSIRAVIRVPMMTRGAYVPTRAIAPHVNRIYAVSDRIADDLSGRYRVARDLIDVIYHGVDPEPFRGALEDKSKDGPLKLLYAGRLWDLDKGVFILPEILRRLKLSGHAVHLTVAGDGPDGPELRRRFEHAGVMALVTMTGGLSLHDVHEQFRRADVFVFPSRFEGCGFAVLEAMAAGCAPAVSDIRGSLRVIVDEGKAGGLARVGDAGAFAEIIGNWVKNRDALKIMQNMARKRFLACYTLDHAADRYARSFQLAVSEKDSRAPVRSLDDYEVPRAFKPTWRTLIPSPVKNMARMWLERMGISS